MDIILYDYDDVMLAEFAYSVKLTLPVFYVPINTVLLYTGLKQGH